MGLERVKGIEPSSSAWKAVALPLSYTRIRVLHSRYAILPEMVGEVGLEPTKLKAADLQSAPFATRDTPPYFLQLKQRVKPYYRLALLRSARLRADERKNTSE
jgi:hypothetical protein